MAHFNLSEYETVEERLAKFWEQHPNGRVFTEVIHYDDKRVLIKASLYIDADNAHPTATGFAEEVFGSTPVNKTSFVENCETSAIGRAAANMNLVAKKGKRPSRQEMEKAQRRSAEPEVASTMTKAQQKWVTDQIEAKYKGEPVMTVVNDVLGKEYASLADVTIDESRVLIQKLAGK